MTTSSILAAMLATMVKGASVAVPQLAMTPPPLAQQFSAVVRQALFVSGIPLPSTELSYSYWSAGLEGLAWRRESVAGGVNTTIVADYKSEKMYTMTTQDNQTKCVNNAFSPGTQFKPLAVDPQAQHVGQANVSGLFADEWLYDNHAKPPFPPEKFAWYVETCPTGKAALLLFNHSKHYSDCPYSAGGPCDTSAVRDFTQQLQKGTQPDWLFSLPPGMLCPPSEAPSTVKEVFGH